ncbi:TPA: hypothetical protein N0F65_000790 [Lagenidium giganteum]|uniref:Uncharacterized protein n=1 Tax=Lagenidium giganteum TaxID=4803 RepID=A0AAV2ZJT6_9STRA|nr:TPA: hypothetical protein N0F65_000790 [Lagenidium giganteum]
MASGVRRGVEFDDPKDEEHEEHVARPSRRHTNSKEGSSSSCAFVFRVKKMRSSVRSSTAPAARKAQQNERVARKERSRKRKAEINAETAMEEELQSCLNDDQMALYRIVHTQVKKSLKRTKAEFATSSARRDIVRLTENNLQAMKTEFVAFLKEHAPENVAIHRRNLENARLKALLSMYQERLVELDKEANQWNEIETSVEQEEVVQDESTGSDSTLDATSPSSPTAIVLDIASDIRKNQHDAVKRLGSNASKLTVLDDSIKSIDRLVLLAELQKAKLFDTFHSSAFKGYSNISQPKENLRALLKFAPATAQASAS